MKGFQQHVMFCTAAVFDDLDVEQLEPEDRSFITSYAVQLATGFPNVASVLFITENNCASLVSAHHMAELLEEEYGKHIRYIVLESESWIDAQKTMNRVRARSPFEEQLWVVVGSSGWTLRAVSAILPPEEDIPYIDDISSAVVICGYTYRKEELARLYGHAPVSISTGLN